MGKPAPAPVLDREEIVQTMSEHYLHALVGSDSDDSVHDLRYSPEKWSEGLKKHGVEVCGAFYNAVLEGMGDVAPFLLLSTQEMGHDLALTRNGHGAGFWDGDWDGFGEDVGDKLTRMAKVLGEVNIYLTDEGIVDLM